MDINREAALAFLQQDSLLRIQSLEALRKGTAQIIAQVADGLLLTDTACRLNYLNADSGQAVKALLAQLGPVPVLVSDLASMDGYIMDRMGYKGREVCYNAVYTQKEPLPVPAPLQLGPLLPEQAPLIIPLVHTHDPDETLQFMREGRLLGGYLGEELVGFVGWHEEGSLGMLHVFAQHRRRGFAQALEALIINRTLEMGAVPYGQVIEDNLPSLALQAKMGLELSSKTVSWLFSEEE